MNHLLSQDKRNVIFSTYIMPRFTAALISQEHPKAIMLGGQPGVGKSNFIADQEWDKYGFSIINGDDLRGDHPDYFRLMREDYEHAANLTQLDCNDWIERLINTVAEKRGNMVIEGTMRRPEIITQTIELLNRYGYEISAIILAAPREISLASIMYRYEVQKELGGISRFVRPDGHDQAFAGIRDTLQSIEGNPGISHINIYSRRGSGYKKEYENERLVDKWANSNSPLEVFDKLVSEELALEELRYVLTLYNEALKRARARNAELKYIDSLIELSRPIRKRLEASFELRNNVGK